MSTRTCFRRRLPGRTPRRWWRATIASAAPVPVSWEPKRVLVLSRVTLGADVAVTSVLLAAAKQAFPNAEIVFVGPRKNFELFAADTRLSHAAVEYRRGSLHERLAVWDDLKTLAASPDCLVLDPDSRLTQLGLLPICDEARYHLFESRRYGGASDLNLPALAAQWAQETLAVPNATPYIAVGQASGLPATALHRRQPGSRRKSRQAHPRPLRSGPPRPALHPPPAGHRPGRRRRRSRPRRTRGRPSPRPAPPSGREASPASLKSSPAAASTWATIPPGSMWPRPAASP